MKLVDEYLTQQGVLDYWISTFVHPEMTRSVRPCRPMPPGTRIMVSRNQIDPVPTEIEGTIMLSVMELPPRGGDEYVPVTKSEPIAFIGGNTCIYRGRFEVPLAAAMSHAVRSSHFLRVKTLDEAIAEGREAVRLGPAIRVQIWLSALHLLVDPRFQNAEVSAQREAGRLKIK
jgi:hypothetical protein